MGTRRSGRKAAKRRPPQKNLTRIDRDVARLRESLSVLFAALGLPETAKRGDRGTVADLNAAVLKIQDYLLRTSERLDNILGTLKNHRELLVKMNQRVYQSGTRERIRMELDIMKNTLSILALNGVEVDEGLLPEIQRLRETAGKDDADVASLRKSKESLDRKFDSELRKVDLTAVYRARGREPRKDLPGYG